VLDPANLRLPVEATPGHDPPGIREPRRVTIDIPARLNVGRPEVILVSLTPDAGQASQGPDVYTAYRVVSVAQIGAAGLSVSPDGEEGQALPAGQPVRFAWTVLAGGAGSFEASLSIRLRFYPISGGPPLERVVLLRNSAFLGTAALGLSVPAARSAGVVVAVVGVLALVLCWRTRRPRRRAR
jgi:hypothetical protein